jgi:hypothetical protein
LRLVGRLSCVLATRGKLPLDKIKGNFPISKVGLPLPISDIIHVCAQMKNHHGEDLDPVSTSYLTEPLERIYFPL